MRIIAGEFRGRKLDAPRGDGTRPTTDRVRESLMSALVSLRDGLDGAVVLDAFAGSGALSLEALSRGADTAVLCERDRDAAAVIERNISALRLGHDRARLVRGDVLKRGAAAPGASLRPRLPRSSLRHRSGGDLRPPRPPWRRRRPGP